MKRTRHVLALGVVASAVLAACSGGGGGAVGGDSPGPQPMELTILHINDHHSHLDSKSKTLQLKTAAGAGAASAVVVDAGGFPRMTAAIESLAAHSANVLKLHAGDAQTGTLYFNRAGAIGEADAALMGA
ncbi:MAG: bifunctional metallophosphatase/5'-nucleotidase, partial [Comamonas sp.]